MNHPFTAGTNAGSCHSVKRYFLSPRRWVPWKALFVGSLGTGWGPGRAVSLRDPGAPGGWESGAWIQQHVYKAEPGWKPRKAEPDSLEQGQPQVQHTPIQGWPGEGQPPPRLLTSISLGAFQSTTPMSSAEGLPSMGPWLCTMLRPPGCLEASCLAGAGIQGT